MEDQLKDAGGPETTATEGTTSQGTVDPTPTNTTGGASPSSGQTGEPEPSGGGGSGSGGSGGGSGSSELPGSPVGGERGW